MYYNGIYVYLYFLTTVDQWLLWASRFFLYRISATGISGGDHNREVAALNSDQY